MTKRDVAVWFCKILALQGMIKAVFSLIHYGLIHSGLTLFLVNWGMLGGIRFGGVPFRWLMPALPFGFYLFVWFFSGAIATELVAEGEDSSPLTSREELGWLLVRCLGLWIFLSATIEMAPQILSFAYENFFRVRPATSLRTIGPIQWSFMWAGVITGISQSILGFLLAFTPRIRAALRK